MRKFPVRPRRNQKKTKRDLRYTPPRGGLLSFVPFPSQHLSSPPLLRVTSVGVLPPSVPLSLILGSLPFLHSSSLRPLPLPGTSSLQRHSPFSSGRGLWVGAAPSAQNSSISLIQGARQGLAGLRSQCGWGGRPLLKLAGRRREHGAGAGWGRGEISHTVWGGEHTRQRLRVSLENINILMSLCSSGSIILEDMVRFRFGLIHQMSFKQPLV